MTFNKILFKRLTWYMFVWKCVNSEYTTNNVRRKRYRVYIRFFFRIIDTANVNVFAYRLRSRVILTRYISRCGTVYRSVVDSTRNIAKSTNDIHVCEKNNGIRLFAECYAYARWKCKFVTNVYVCLYMFAGDIFDKRMIWFKTRSAVIRKA